MNEIYLVSEAICYLPCDDEPDLGSSGDLYSTYDGAEREVLKRICEYVRDYYDCADKTNEELADIVRGIFKNKNNEYDEWEWKPDDDIAYYWSITKKEVKE